MFEVKKLYNLKLSTLFQHRKSFVLKVLNLQTFVCPLWPINANDIGCKCISCVFLKILCISCILIQLWKAL